MLRIRAGTDTLVIGLRAELGPDSDECRLDSLDDVRQRLIHALVDPAAVDALRRFWAQWQCEPFRINRINDRRLIDLIAAMTIHGPLAVYLAPDSSVRHVYGHAAMRTVDGQRATALVPLPMRIALAGDVARVGKITLEKRLAEVLDEVPLILSSTLSDQFIALLESPTRSSIQEVLTVWAKSREVGLGFITDAVVLAMGLMDSESVAMEAAETIYEALQDMWQARTEDDLHEAAQLLAEAIVLIGVRAFSVVIRRGAYRISGGTKVGRD